MNLFNLFSRQSKSPIENKIISVRDKILAQLAKNEKQYNLTDNSQFLETEYKKFISVILSGSLIRVSYMASKSVSENDPLIKQIFSIIFDEALSFQKKYIITDKINYDLLGHERLKEKHGIQQEIFSKYHRYVGDIEHGLKTSEPYYFEGFDDPEAEFSGYKNHFLFLRELFFRETFENDNGIKIKNNEYDVDWDNLDNFFRFIKKIYSDI
jgi:hypothetical protein